MLNFRCIRAASRRFVEFKKPSMKFRNLLSKLNMLLGYKRRQTEAHDLLYSADLVKIIQTSRSKIFMVGFYLF